MIKDQYSIFQLLLKLIQPIYNLPLSQNVQLRDKVQLYNKQQLQLQRHLASKIAHSLTWPLSKGVSHIVPNAQ